MIVADANVVAYLLIAGDQSAAARALWAADPVWRLPHLWRYEFLNILATLGRAGRVSPAELTATWHRAIELLGSSEHEPDPALALAIALEHGISAYDAQYVALALQLQALLITEDRKLRRAFPAHTASLRSFLADETS
jgi:predicted nucleic acid-binding protein